MFDDFDDEDFIFGDDFGDDNFDEDDMFNFDDEDEDAEVDIKPVKVLNKSVNNANLLPVAKVMSTMNTGNTLATVQSINTITEQDKVFEVQRMMRQSEFNTTLFSALSSINDNLVQILNVKTDNDTTFMVTGMHFFGDQIDLMKEMIELQKGDNRPPEEKKDDYRAKNTKSKKENIFLSTGALDIESYFKNIVSNVKDMDEFSSLFDIVDDLSGSDEEDLERLIQYPLKFIPQMIVKSLVPNVVQDSLKLADSSISAFTGAFFSKLNSWIDNDDDNEIIGRMKDFIGRMFGYTPDRKSSVDLGAYEKGAVSFDGITRRTIIDVIPTYLRRIESAITNSPERVYDYDRGVFEDIASMKTKYEDSIAQAELSGYSDILLKLNKMVDNLKLEDDQDKSLRKDINEYFRTMTQQGKAISPFIRYNALGEEVDDLYRYDLFEDSSNRDIFRTLMHTFDKPTLMKMFGENMFDSINSQTSLFEEIERNHTMYGYKYFNDKSHVDKDYFTDKYGKTIRKNVFELKDDFDNSSLDYVRDIRSILLNGITVFIGGDTGSKQFIDPNDEFKKKVATEEKKVKDDKESRATHDIFMNENKRDIDAILKLAPSELSEILKVENSEEDEKRYQHFLDALKPNSKGLFGGIREKLNNGLVKVVGNAGDKINDFLYRIIFGDEEDNSAGIENYLDYTKTKLSAFHSWTINKVYEPVKESFIGPNGIITKLKESPLFKKITEKKNILLEKLLGEKDEAGNRRGGLLSTIRNKTVDFFKAVKHSFTGESYVDSEGNTIAEDDNVFFKKMKRTGEDLFKQSKDFLMGKDGEDGILKRGYKSFMEGMDNFKTSLFGKASLSGYESEGRKSMTEFAQDIKSKLPKAFGRGLVFSFAKFAFASKLGVLGSLFMPGGVLGSVLTGTVMSLVTQSETFKKWAFGEEDPEEPGRRLGGFIPKSLQDFYHDNKIKLGVGAGAGVLTSFFLPGGPIFGALMGMGSVFVSKTDAFQEFLYGPDFANGDKNLMNGFFGRAYGRAKDLFAEYGIDPKLATFLGGLGAGAGALGLIPSFFLPGGPIGGALLGAAGGIAASSNKFQTWLFGDKGFDGKRSGGVIDKFKTFFDIEVIDSLKITMKEWNLKISDFLYDHVAEPFLAGLDPMKQILIDTANGVKNMFSNGWNFIKENVLGVFKDNVIKPFGDSLKKFVVDPLKKMLRGTFGLLGKFVGGVISAPFKIFGMLGRRADAKATTEEEIEKRQKVQEARDARAEKRAARREQVQSEIDELKANQKKDREFFRRDGRFRNEQQKEKWETQQREKELWYQQHIAESGAEAADKLDEINQAISSLESLSPKILYTLEENILQELRNLRSTASDQLKYFRSEGYVDTRYLRKEKEEPKKTSTDFDRQMWLHEANKKAVDEIKEGASGPTISQHLKNDPSISNEAKKNQDPTVNNVISILRKHGQSHDEGLDSVPYDGYVAELHKGERIIPSSEAEQPLKVMMVGGYLDAVKTIGESDAGIDQDALPVLEKIQKNTKTSADAVRDQLNGVGWNLHHIRKMMQYLTGLNEADVEKINDVNLADTGFFGQLFGKVRRGTSSVFDFISKPFKNLFNVITAPFKWVGKTIQRFADTMANVVNKFLEIPGKIIGTMMDVASNVIKGASKILFQGLELGLKGVTTVVSDLYKGSRWLVTNIAKNFVPVLSGAGKLIGSVFTGMAKTAGVALQAVAGLGKGIYTATKDILGFTYQFGKDLIKGAWNIGKDIAKGIWNVGKNIVAAPFKLIGKLFGKSNKSNVTKVEVVGGYLDTVKLVESINGIKVQPANKISESDNVETKENLKNIFTNSFQSEEYDDYEELLAGVSRSKLSLLTPLNNIVEHLTEGVIAAKDKINESFSSIAETISEKLTNIKDDISNTFENISNNISKPFKKVQGLFNKDKDGGEEPLDININNESTINLPIPFKQSKGGLSSKEQYERQIQEQRKQLAQEEDNKQDLIEVRRKTSDFMKAEKAKKEQEKLLSTYHSETMTDIDSTEKILTKQYDFWYDLFGKNGKVETFLNGLWDFIKSVGPLLLNWFKGSGFGKALGGVFNKLFGGLGLKDLIVDAVKIAAPFLVGLGIDSLDKSERDKRSEEYNLTDTESYLGVGKDSRYAGEEEGYILNGSRLENKGKLYKNLYRDALNKNIPNRIYNTVKTIGSRGFELGKSVVENGKNVKNTVGNNISKLKNKFGFGGTSVADDIGGGLTEVIQGELLDADGKPIKNVTASFVDIADDVATENKGLVKKFLSMLDDAIKKVVQFVGDKLGNSKIVSKVDNVVKPIISKLTGKIDDIIKKYAPKIASFLGITSAGTATAFVLDAGFLIWDVATGQSKSETANLFGVKPEQVNARMRTISAALKAISKFSWIEVIYLANEVAADLLDVNLMRWLAGLIYKLIASDEESAQLSANQDAMEAEWKAYNEENGTNLSKEAYIDMQSPTVFEKMINSKAVQTIAKPFSKSGAANALGKDVDDVNLWDRVKYFGGMAANGFMNLFRSEENDKEISEFFGKGKIMKDEKGNVITDENGVPMYYDPNENAGMGDEEIDPKTGKPVKGGKFDWSTAFKSGLAGTLVGGPMTGLATGIMAGNPQVQEYFKNLADKASEWLGFEIDDSKGVLGNLSEGFKALKGKIQAWWTRDDDDINKVLGKDKDAKVTNLQRKGWGAVKAFNWAANFFRDEEKELTATEEYEKIKETFGSIGENIWNWLGKRLENIKGIMSKIKDGFTAVKDVVSGWLGFAEEEVEQGDENDESWGDKISTSVKNGWNKFKSLFSFNAYEQGTPWVPDTQVALIHEGEMIVPADYNPLSVENDSMVVPGITDDSNNLKYFNDYLSPTVSADYNPINGENTTLSSNNWVDEAAYTMENNSMVVPGITDDSNNLKYFNDYLSPTVDIEPQVEKSPIVETTPTPALIEPEPNQGTITYDPNNMNITLGTGASTTIYGLDESLSNRLVTSLNDLNVSSTSTPDYSGQLTSINDKLSTLNESSDIQTEVIESTTGNITEFFNEESDVVDSRESVDTTKDVESNEDKDSLNKKESLITFLSGGNPITKSFFRSASENEKVQELIESSKEWFGTQKDKISTSYNEAKDKWVEKYNVTKDKIFEGYEGIKNKTIDGYNFAKDKISTSYNEAKDKWVEKYNVTKDKIIDAYTSEDEQAVMMNRILTGDKNAEATHSTRMMYDISKFTTKLYNLNPFIDEENKLTEEEGAALLADTIKTKIMEPISKAKEAVVNKFNEMKDAAKEWIDETKGKVISFYNEKIKEPLEDAKDTIVEKYEDLKESTIAWIGETKEKVISFYNEKIKEPLSKAKDTVLKKYNEMKTVAKAWIDESKEKVIDFYNEKIKDPVVKKYKDLKESAIAWIGETKEKVISFYNEKVKEPLSKAKGAIIGKLTNMNESAKKWIAESKEKVIDFYNDKIKEPISKLTGKAKQKIEDMKNSAKEWIDSVKEKIVDSFNKYIKDPVVNAFNNIASGVEEGINNLVEKFKPVLDFLNIDIGINDGGKENKKKSKELVEENLGTGSSIVQPLKQQIKPKNYIFNEQDNIYSASDAGTTDGRLRDKGNTHNFPYYSQLDERWGKEKLIGQSTIGRSGCGPTAAAMVLTHLTGQYITPDTMAKVGEGHLPGYAAYSYFPEVASRFKLNYDEISGNDSAGLVAQLKSGKPVIISGFDSSNSSASPYTNEGHIVVATGIDGNYVQINDPRGPAYSGSYHINDIIRGMKQGIVYSATNQTADLVLPGSGVYNENAQMVDEYNEIEVVPFDPFNPLGSTGSGQVTVADRVLSYARAFLQNTSKFKYSQAQNNTTGRYGIDHNNIGADCSSFVSHVISVAGDTGKISYLSQSFWDSAGTKVDSPQIGDVVCQQGHVGLYSGDGKYIHMSGRKDGIKESKAIQRGNNPHRGYKRVLKNPSAMVDPTITGGNSLLGTVVATSSGNPVTSGGGTAPIDGTTDSAGVTGGGASSAIPELGVFDLLSNAMSNIVASMYNGKQVDLFGSSSSSSDANGGGTTPTGDATWDGTQYDLSSYDMSDLDSKKQGHINSMIQATLHTYKTHGLFPSLTIAQSAVESGWGPTSGLATQGKAMFGIKATSDWTGKVYTSKTREVYDGKNTTITAGFRAYDNYNDGIIDRANFLKQNQRYTNAGVFTASTPEEQAAALKAAGYATDPNYVSSLTNMINSSNLKRFDTPRPPRVAGSSDTSTDSTQTRDVNAGTGDKAFYEPMTTADLTQAYGSNAGMDPEETDPNAATPAETTTEETTTGGTTPGGIPTSINNFAYYKQSDPTWNESLINGHSISKGGCGPTTLAMIATQLSGKVITPVTMAKAAEKAGHWKGYALWSLFDWFGEKFGLNTKVIPSNDLKTAKEELSKGNVIAVSGKTVKKGDHTPYTSGHIVPFIGLDSNNKIIVNDSRGPQYAHAYDDSGLAQGTTNHMRQGWSYSGQISIPSEIEVSGDYTGGGFTGGGTTDGAGVTGGGASSAIPELGVFDLLSNAMSNIVASMYNGKQVDLFGSSSSSGSVTSDGSSNSGGADISGISDNAQAAWTYFTSANYSPHATAGIMGNLQQESGLDPTIKQHGGGPGRGIAQWTVGEGRFKGLEAHAQSKGKDWTDLQSQLEWVDMELNGKDPSTVSILNKRYGGISGFKAANDVKWAVEAFEKSYERAGKPNYTNRYKFAEQFFSKFSNAGTGDELIAVQDMYIDRLNNDTYFSQSDPQWNDVSYGGNMLSDAGCGPTSLAMIASQLTGKNITPDLVAQAAHEDGVWSDSSSWDIFPWFAQQLGLEYKTSGMNQLDELNALLGARYSVVASGKLHEQAQGRSPFTTQGHIVPILGLQNNKYLINDPRGESYSGLYTVDELVNSNSVLRAAYGYKSTSKTMDYLANSRFNPELLTKLTPEENEPEVDTSVSLGDTVGKQYNVSELYKNAGLGPDGQSKSVTNVVHTYKPETVTKVSKPISDLNIDILSNLKSTINTGQQSSLATDSEMTYIKACLESLNIAVQELKSINENTKQTAENISSIQIYSANEPVSTGNTHLNDKETKLKNTKPINKSGTVNPMNTEEYKIARMIASFRK